MYNYRSLEIAIGVNMLKLTLLQEENNVERNLPMTTIVKKNNHAKSIIAQR